MKQRMINFFHLKLLCFLIFRYCHKRQTLSERSCADRCIQFSYHPVNLKISLLVIHKLIQYFHISKDMPLGHSQQEILQHFKHISHGISALDI